jgi:type VI secretion system protein ImpK
VSRNPTDPPPDPNRTVLVPRPGARRAPAPAPAGEPLQNAGARLPEPPATGRAAAAAGAVDSTLLLATPLRQASASNPLLRAAGPLLSTVVPLRSMPTHPDLEDLRARLVAGIRDFEKEARAAKIELMAISAARYSLCTLIDEAISSTPWGGGGAWSGRSLLVTFHNEGSGGEKFFLILQKLCQDARANIDVLELMYVCLALGLEGRYRLIDGGRDQLLALRERLLEIIRAQRGPVEHDLSPHWKGVVDRRNPLLGAVPIWVACAAAGVLLLMLHLSLLVMLNRSSDPVFAALHGIRVAIAAPAPAATAPAPPKPELVRLSGFLKPEVDRGLVTVDEQPGKSIVTIKGDGMFPSGSAEVAPAFQPLLERIGDALKEVPGTVQVLGHTDDQRILSVRFPSNWALSKARAEAVERVLAERAGAPVRFSAEGRGELEPLVPNDNPVNRARNRRVDLVVFPAPAS